jgi:thiol peroxidase
MRLRKHPALGIGENDVARPDKPECAGTCAASVKKFNEEAGSLGDTVIVNVSKDLPFAQGRFCESNGVEHGTNVSAFRCDGFGKSYGVALTDGPLKGLLSRAVVVVGADGKVAYTELVPEIVDEPNYDAALAAVK